MTTSEARRRRIQKGWEELEELKRRFEAHAATLPTTRDLVDRCWICGEKEERFSFERNAEGVEMGVTYCAACGHKTILGTRERLGG